MLTCFVIKEKVLTCLSLSDKNEINYAKIHRLAQVSYTVFPGNKPELKEKNLMLPAVLRTAGGIALKALYKTFTDFCLKFNKRLILILTFC